METRTILEKIRQRGFTISAIGNAISLSPKRLLNDRMISFVREHKEELLTALYQEQDERKSSHLERKRALHQDRLEVLRCLIRRYLNSGDPIRVMVTDSEVDEYFDWVLRQHDYDFEDAISTYRNLIPEPNLMCKCRYRPPFCSCGGAAASGRVTCNDCKYFIPDQVGDGAGIGHCTIGLQYTQELNGHRPLYRYADRCCDRFSLLQGKIE